MPEWAFLLLRRLVQALRPGVLEFGFRVQGSGFRVQGLGFRVQGSGFRVQGSGFRVQGSGFRVQGSGFRVCMPRCWDSGCGLKLKNPTGKAP